MIKTIINDCHIPIAAYIGSKQVWQNFTPAELFINGEHGVWFDPSDLSTLFQDIDGLEPVTKDGDPVALIKDKSGNGSHATQEIASARPIYRTDGKLHWLDFDGVDDVLDTTLINTYSADMYIATEVTLLSMKVDISDHTITLKSHGESSRYLAGREFFGLCIREDSIQDIQTSKLKDYYNLKGTTSFNNLTTANMSSAFRNWNILRELPVLDVSGVTNYSKTWENCYNMVAFPKLDFDPAIYFRLAWARCTSLRKFPKNSFDEITRGNFENAFTRTNLDQESIDGILVSLVASGVDSGTRIFDQSEGDAPSEVGEAAIDTLRSRGWTVTVTGGY